MNSMFVGPAGVRAGWRALGFIGLFIVLTVLWQLLLAPLAARVPAWQVRGAIVPQAMAVEEVLIFFTAFVSTLILAKFEKRPVLSYGFQNSGDAGRCYVEGTVLGVLAFAIVGALMYVFGGFKVDGFNLHGTQWLVYPLLWLGIMLLVGIAEEMAFRGYGVYALARGMGFWPAAIVMTVLFGLAHLTKDGENAVDIVSIMCFGLFLCFTLWRTGSLWLAAGFHFAVDYMQFFIIGTRNGAAVPVGHLLNSSFPGPAWVNGGRLGTEASLFVFPVIVLLFLVVHGLHPTVRFTESSGRTAQAF